MIINNYFSEISYTKHLPKYIEFCLEFRGFGGIGGNKHSNPT